MNPHVDAGRVPYRHGPHEREVHDMGCFRPGITHKGWHVDTKMDPEVCATGHKEPASALAFTPDGSLLATASCDGTICTWDMRSRKRAADIMLETAGYGISSISFRSDGLLCCVGCSDSLVHVYDVRMHREVQCLGAYRNAHAPHDIPESSRDPDNGCTFVKYSPIIGDHTLAAGFMRGRVNFFDSRGKTIRKILNGRCASDYYCTTSFVITDTMATHVLVGSEDGTIYGFSTIDDKREDFQLRGGHRSHARAIDHHPTLGIIASGSAAENDIVLWTQN
ncbi:hypothetical protein QR680_006683 [Steinernema hermaphroditum]|uniref:Anaphase-promoting complex subunit 4 WD40 domain-containing protein n=1 Tax=Steinernema hermaphroditum TaxID=289476 RepID=A0AA39HYP8_9BILA|nr:hypothetical protein QR680_006683 [Steinernema hermaphroditum]